MIFVTLGSQKFQFNRLLKALDEQIAEGKIREEVFAQTGASDYIPKHFSFVDYLDRGSFSEMTKKADIVITHGGTGAIIGALKKGKKVIAVPRLARYGEHVDDHQLQLLEQFGELHLIRICQDCGELWRAVEEVKKTEFERYQSNTPRFLESIERYIEENT